mmetsp:Transcript_43410/g.57475  ORF Transcript_43410/g.57475 Transcript_43410/m.57475 type:complete len:92 (+) Transcript_43410:18-293(+)
MISKLLPALAALASTSSADMKMKMEQLEPGVFHIPLKKHYMLDEDSHRSLSSNHPVVGDWASAEYWNHIVKEPITSEHLGNYMYTVECRLG